MVSSLLFKFRCIGCNYCSPLFRKVDVVRNLFVTLLFPPSNLLGRIIIPLMLHVKEKDYKYFTIEIFGAS